MEEEQQEKQEVHPAVEEQLKQPNINEDAVKYLEEMEKTAKRLEEANKKHEEILQKQAELKIEQTLGGRADAGEGKKELSPKEYKEKVMSGEIKPNDEK